MANTKQAKKRVRQAEKARAHNASLRSTVRTYMKRVDTAIEKGDSKAAEAAYTTAVPYIDSMVSKGIFHKNKAARHKSRLLSKIRQIGKAA